MTAEMFFFFMIKISTKECAGRGAGLSRDSLLPTIVTSPVSYHDRLNIFLPSCKCEKSKSLYGSLM